MKKSVMVMIGCIMAVSFVFSGMVEAAETLTIAFFDFRGFEQKSTKFSAAKKRFADKLQAEQVKLEKMKEDYLNLQDELKKQGPMLKEETRNAKLKELGQKEIEFKLAEQQAKQILQNDERELMEVLQRDLKKIIDALREQKRFTMILNSQAAILSADSALDITDQIIAAYDATPATGAGPGPRPAAPTPKPKPPVKPTDRK